MAKEFKPGFIGWLFSVIIAAGFGSLLADAVRYVVVEASKSEAELLLRDKHYVEETEKNRIVWHYYIENVGDKPMYIVDVSVDGVDHPRFFSNSAIEVYLGDVTKPIKRTHVAVAKPHKMLMIGIIVPLGSSEPNEICISNGDIKKICM